MALSRIWAAFIIIACLVGLYKSIDGRRINPKLDLVQQSLLHQASATLPDSIAKKVNVKDSAGYIAFAALPATYHPLDSTFKDFNKRREIAEGDKNIFSWMVSGRSEDPANPLKKDGIIATCGVAVNLAINLIGVMALFMGFMSIAEKAGGINVLSRIIGPFFTKLFPEVPKGHPAFGHMMMNFSANLLGLDNAATPFGLKTMQSLQEINPNKETASNAQIMFLCLHASGLTLIPVAIIATRASLKAANPTDVFVPCMIATFVATLASMSIVSYKQKINVFQPVILAWVLGLSTVILGLVVYLKHLPLLALTSFSGLLSNGIILLIFFLIVLGALYKKIDMFSAFVEGAKEGFTTAVRIIPYLVGLLVAISMLRTSGTFDVIINGMKYFFGALGADTRFVDGLPTALVKPMSGSAARGMMIDTMKTYGPDSFAGKLSSVLQGSSETTFYVVAVYFGSVNIKNTRYSIGTMLLSDLCGIIASIFLAYLFFA